MRITFRPFGIVWVTCSLIVFAAGGCSQKEASDTLSQLEQSAEEAAETVAKDVGEAVKKGEEMATQLGEQALAYLSPLKEQFGDLERLKDSPAELKEAVSNLIQSIEEKAEDLQLPEKVSSALTTAKEKLIALKDYLEGEVEQAKIDEHIKDIVESVKSQLGI